LNGKTPVSAKKQTKLNSRVTNIENMLQDMCTYFKKTDEKQISNNDNTNKNDVNFNDL